MTTGTCSVCGTAVPEHSRYCLACGTDLASGTPRQTSTVTQELEVRLASAIGGRYRIERLLGRGGMGAVFLAQDLALERPVAIKVLPPEVAHDENLVKRFEHEARIAAKLDHPGIMPIYAVESAAGLHFFVMKYVDGRSLEDLLIERPRLDIEECQHILWEAARALGHAHRRGVIHRDIKPANLVLEEDGRPVLTDFGISKALESASEFTGTGQIVGTPHYMSPEQARGLGVDGRSDQYGLAVLGYRMLSGRLPFEDDSLHTVIFKHVFESARRLDTYRADTPPFLVEAIHRALSKTPSDRFPTMEAFATAVWPEHPISAPVGAGRPSGERRVPTPETEAPTEITEEARLHARRKPGRRRGAWTALALAFVVVAAGTTAAWALLGRGGIGGQAAVPPPDYQPGPAEPGADSLLRAAGVAESIATSAAESTTAPARDAGEGLEVEGGRASVPTIRAPTVGYLTVAAEPWGILYVDQRRIGDTPVYGLALRPGAHVIRIQQDGHRIWVDTIVVVAGDTARRSVRLVRANQ